jgi:CIC family chloride channel protein
MTGSLSLLAPAMIAVAVATAVVGDRTIYEAQLRDRASALHHRLKLSRPLLASVSVSEALERAAIASLRELASEVVLRVRERDARGVAVVDGNGRAVGAAAREAIERAATEKRAIPLGDIMVPVVVSGANPLEDAMFAQARAAAHVAVVTEGGAPVGIATYRGILGTYLRAREGRAGPHTSATAPPQV